MDFYQRINNKKLYKEIKKYKEKLKECPDIKIPDYIQICFYIMANKISYQRNFIRYTYRTDMISEAMIICLKYVATFDCEKSKNPYSYFNQAINNSFVQFIQKEKKQSIIKNEMLILYKNRTEGHGRKVCNNNKNNYEDKVWE